MRVKFFGFLFVAYTGLVPTVFSSSVVKREPIDWVNPFLGTQSARWFFFTPAAMPFGLVKLAPDTTGYGGYRGGGHPSGYRYSDSTIIGFSHLHDFQLGGVLLMPSTGPLITEPGPDGQEDAGWRSPYKKASETASPGYYRVLLDKYGVNVELTATTRAGYHRYTFPPNETARVLIDVGRPLGEGGVTQTEDQFNGSLRDAFIEQVDDRTLRAYSTIAPSYAERAFTIYTEIQFDRPFTAQGAYRGGASFPGRKVITGFGAGYYVEFAPSPTQVVHVQVGISFVSLEQAHKNLSTEIGVRSFDEVKAEARNTWNEMLGRIQIYDDAPAASPNKVKFYTGLWHVLLGRGISSDADGSYLDGYGRRQQIPLEHGVPAFARYTTDALWGSFWNLNQVWALVYPEHMTSFARYLLSVYDETGWLQDGYVVNQRAPGMLSNQTTPFLAAAFARAPNAFDGQKLWNAIWKNQTEWRNRPRFSGQEALPGYSLLGYAPCDDIGYGPSGHTLEYAFADWAAAQVGLALGKTKEAEFLLRRSSNWKNLWDATTCCFRPRYFDGHFVTPFNPDSGFSYAEGTARQYRWFVPHDVDGLIALFGKDKFIAELTTTLRSAERSDFGPSRESNTAGYALPYNHGNQPDLHAAWLFVQAGRPELAQQYVRSIADRFYGLTPEHGYGYGQDEDQGQLGAWFVLAALGLFDVKGMVEADATMAMIPPLFQRIEVILPASALSGAAPSNLGTTFKLPLKPSGKGSPESLVPVREFLRSP